MCKVKKYHKTSNTSIDICMKPFIKFLNGLMPIDLKIIACCCGHKKYPMTIIVTDGINYYDIVSNTKIERKRNFYKRDKQGYYFIPEVIKK